jgi:protein SCO1/2
MQLTKLKFALAAFAVVLVIAGGQFARAAHPAPTSPITDNSKTQRYVLTGTVQAIDIPNHQITVDGDAVPGYMDAMSMPYSVPDDAALKALNVGDIIRADIVVQGNDAHLENIKVTGHAKPKT